MPLILKLWKYDHEKGEVYCSILLFLMNIIHNRAKRHLKRTITCARKLHAAGQMVSHYQVFFICLKVLFTSGWGSSMSLNKILFQKKLSFTDQFCMSRIKGLVMAL